MTAPHTPSAVPRAPRIHLATRRVPAGGPRVSHGSMRDAHTPACMQAFHNLSDFHGDFLTVTLELVTCEHCLMDIFLDGLPSPLIRSLRSLNWMDP
jgi:hypothetical protein